MTPLLLDTALLKWDSNSTIDFVLNQFLDQVLFFFFWQIRWFLAVFGYFVSHVYKIQLFWYSKYTIDFNLNRLIKLISMSNELYYFGDFWQLWAIYFLPDMFCLTQNSNSTIDLSLKTGIKSIPNSSGLNSLANLVNF